MITSDIKIQNHYFFYSSEPKISPFTYSSFFRLWNPLPFPVLEREIPFIINQIHCKLVKIHTQKTQIRTILAEKQYQIIPLMLYVSNSDIRITPT